MTNPSAEYNPVEGVESESSLVFSTDDISETSDLVYDTSLRPPTEILEANRRFWNLAGAGKLAICLARQSYFGDAVLRVSTIKGKDRAKLDERKMASLRSIVHKVAFPSKTWDQFRAEIMPKIDQAIAGVCKRARSTQGTDFT